MRPDPLSRNNHKFSRDFFPSLAAFVTLCITQDQYKRSRHTIWCLLYQLDYFSIWTLIFPCKPFCKLDLLWWMIHVFIFMHFHCFVSTHEGFIFSSNCGAVKRKWMEDEKGNWNCNESRFIYLFINQCVIPSINIFFYTS